jgi:hypothetical protein
MHEQEVLTLLTAAHQVGIMDNALEDVLNRARGW